MDDSSQFVERIRMQYPEGLTGVIVIAGTRTTYILEKNQDRHDPGNIDNLFDYTDYIFGRYFELIRMYYSVGGHNLIIPGLSYQSFYERGEQYADVAIKAFPHLIGDEAISFYKKHNVDPYFVGIDTIQQLPNEHPAHELRQQFIEFSQHWPYAEHRRKLIWEVAPIPLYTYWKQTAQLNQELQEKAQSITDLRKLHDTLYAHYSQAVYGVQLPVPHFYIGSNRNGELKLRAMYPISMLCGGPFRLYFLPYPTLYMTKQVLQAILEDLAFSKPLRALAKDYSGQFTSEMIESERQRIQKLSQDPNAIAGLTRKITT